MQEAEELYDLREGLEALAVEKAIERLDDAALEKLRQKVETYGQDIEKRFTRERLLYDQEIHVGIAEITGNETLTKALEQVFERIILKRKTDGLYHQVRGAIAHGEHLSLLEAMQRRDVAQAVQIVRHHIREGKKNVLSDLRQQKEIREFQMADSAKAEGAAAQRTFNADKKN